MRMGDYADLGVLYWHLNPKDYEKDEELQRIRETRGYNYMVVHSSYYFLLRILNIDLPSIYMIRGNSLLIAICLSQYLNTEELQLQK